MADDKSKQGGQDDARVDVNDPNELSFIAEKFGVSLNEVRLAVQKAGTDIREDIYRMLENRPA
jgi:hypothetical protein